jgi:hypothetical protein
MKRNKKTAAIAIIMGFALLLSACTTEEPETVRDINARIPGNEWMAGLEPGQFYVRHKGENSYEPLYLGNTTFDAGETPSAPNPTRVAWFRSDYANIPTLYKDDSLVLYTQSVLSESFSTERFADFGFSFGVIGLFVSPSGRYKAPTQEGNLKVYPGGDTSSLLDFQNESVIIDSIGGVHINVPEYTEEGELYKSGVQFLTKCGSIANATLNKDESYDVVLYAGTEGYHYRWQPDVRIMYSMEVNTFSDFEFESETIIKVPIPEYYNTGMYLLNGVGMFRYVKEYTYEERSKFDIDNVDYNVPNEYPELHISYGSPYIGDEETTPVSEFNPDSNKVTGEVKKSGTPATQPPSGSTVLQKDVKTETFNLTAGQKVQAEVVVDKLYDDDSLESVRAEVYTPDYTAYPTTKNNNVLSVMFFAPKDGVYEVNVYNLKGRNCTITMTEIV